MLDEKRQKKTEVELDEEPEVQQHDQAMDTFEE